jgi:hypothetical protein
MRKQIICRLMLALFLPGLLFVSCYSATNQPTITPTNLADTVFLVTLTPTLIPTKDVTIMPMQTRKTKTPAPLASVTRTPEACPPFILDSDLPDPNLPENYIGYRYDHHELPLGLEYLGGSLVSDTNNHQYELGISKLEWHENSRLYWLERLICHDEAGYPYYEIVDSFATSPLSGDETEPWVCFDGETEVHFVGGLGLYDESIPKVTIGDYRGWLYTKIVFIYDIDYVAQKFILLDPDSLTCLEGGRP